MEPPRVELIQRRGPAIRSSQRPRERPVNRLVERVGYELFEGADHHPPVTIGLRGLPRLIFWGAGQGESFERVAAVERHGLAYLAQSKPRFGRARVGSCTLRGDRPAADVQLVGKGSPQPVERVAEVGERDVDEHRLR